MSAMTPSWRAMLADTSERSGPKTRSSCEEDRLSSSTAPSAASAARNALAEMHQHNFVYSAIVNNNNNR